MREQVLENYGVRVTATPGGVRYTLPWMRHRELKESGWGLLLVSALPCAAASLLPALVMRFMLAGAPAFGMVFMWVFALIWWLMSVCFAGMFGAMAYSAFTKWGRARIRMNYRRIAAVQLRGGESRVAYVGMGNVRGFATIVDGDDKGNPATPGRLLVDMNNNVSRLVGGYPLELLEALKEDLTVRMKESKG